MKIVLGEFEGVLCGSATAMGLGGAILIEVYGVECVKELSMGD